MTKAAESFRNPVGPVPPAHNTCEGRQRLEVPDSEKRVAKTNPVTARPPS